MARGKKYLVFLVIAINNYRIVQNIFYILKIILSDYTPLFSMVSFVISRPSAEQNAGLTSLDDISVAEQ